jgi:glycopeptide antibiotics resistance protein
MNRKVIFSVVYFQFLLCVVLLNPLRFEHIIPIGIRLRVHPFTDSLRDISYARGHNWCIHWFEFLGNILGNIILFIPFPFIAIHVFRMTGVFAILGIAFLLSLGIEVAQYYTGLGVADVDDIILNTAGAAIGFYLCRRFILIRQ